MSIEIGGKGIEGGESPYPISIAGFESTPGGSVGGVSAEITVPGSGDPDEFDFGIDTTQKKLVEFD